MHPGQEQPVPADQRPLKSIVHCPSPDEQQLIYRRKLTREQLHWHLQQMRFSGEPGWVNEEAGKKRRPNFLRLQSLRRNPAR